MRKFLTVLGFAVAAIPSMAQTNYNKSVFANFKSMQAAASSNTAKRSPQQWQNTLPGWQSFNDKLSGSPRDIMGPAVAIPGNTINEKLQYSFNQVLPALGINKNEWLQTAIENAPRAYFAHFQQSFAGHKVAFAKLILQYTLDGKLLRVQNHTYGQPDLNLAPSVTPQAALTTAAQDVDAALIAQQSINPDWVWFPIPTPTGYVLHPSWKFNINGKAEELQLSGYVDALTGELLYRDNETKETFDMSVKGSVYKQNPTVPASLESLPYLLINIGTSPNYTDTAGQINVATLNPPVTTSVRLEGKWSKVTTNTSTTIPAFTYIPVTNGTVYTYPSTTPSSDRHVNAYYHVNRVHNFMKGYFPTFTGMDFSLPTKVDVASGNCNAFYTGNGGGSINFYAAGGGCPSFAYCGDIIYHEYGHAISDKFYLANSSSSIDNGGLNEGSSDVWGMCITHNPILGLGSGGTTNYIRRYDVAPKVYPQDLTGEVHANGEIIAGCWWDVAVNVNNPDTMARLFTSSYHHTPDGPNGTEGQVYHDVLMAALIEDDNDNLLSNGTPHFAEIVNAFAKHGIYLLSDITLTHTEIAHQTPGFDIPVAATVNSSNPDFFQTLKLYYRKRGNSAWDSVTLAQGAGLSFSGNIPAQTYGSIIDYYFSALDLLSYKVNFPTGVTLPNPGSNNQSNIPYQFGVGVAPKVAVDFETVDTAWHVGNNSTDNATGGIWIQAVPIGSVSNGVQCQTGNDHTSGSGKCLVTGNATSATSPVGTADVDNGSTSVITPTFDLSAYDNPIIEYYRWFSNDRGTNARTDYWEADIKTPASAIWVPVDRTLQSDNTWRRRIFAVKEFISTKVVVMKFVANDGTANGASTYEAAVDDFYIYDQKDNTGVSSEPRVTANIYPNPANALLYVTLPAAGFTGSIALYDLTGRSLQKIDINASATEYTFNTRQLAAGQYFVVVQTGKNIQTKKVTIAH